MEHSAPRIDTHTDELTDELIDKARPVMVEALTDKSTNRVCALIVDILKLHPETDDGRKSLDTYLVEHKDEIASLKRREGQSNIDVITRMVTPAIYRQEARQRLTYIAQAVTGYVIRVPDYSISIEEWLKTADKGGKLKGRTGILKGRKAFEIAHPKSKAKAKSESKTETSEETSESKGDKTEGETFEASEGEIVSEIDSEIVPTLEHFRERGTWPGTR